MDNQHKLIKGYRDLCEEEIALMNKIKAHAANVELLWEEILQYTSKQFEKAVGTSANMFEEDEEELNRLDKADVYNWVNRAKEDLQDGFMKLVRAVAQPTTF